MGKDVYEKVFDLAKRRGFLYPSYDIYGGVAGFYDYGPLGAAMKSDIENLWRRFYVVEEGFAEIHTPVIGPEDVFRASGHLAGFADVIVECPRCGESYRADHFLRDEYRRLAERVKASGHAALAGEYERLAEAADKAATADAMRAIIASASTRREGPVQLGAWGFTLKDGKGDAVRCPNCKGEMGPEPTISAFNLMFKTNVGPGAKRVGYMRPETAQGIFTDFPFLYRYFREQLPFGVVQIGKSFRNEISPRQGLLRLREFTQMEAEVFVDAGSPESHANKRHPRFARAKDAKLTLVPNATEKAAEMRLGDAVGKGVIANEALGYYVWLTHRFLVAVGLDPKKLRFRQHRKTEMAHYANDCWDAEFLSERFGWVECVGIADRGAYDLSAHEKVSGLELKALRRFPEPREVRRKAVRPLPAKLGPRYKEKSKAIADALAQLDGAQLKPGRPATVHVDSAAFEVPAECFAVEEVVERSVGEKFTPHVVEPSYGVDRILYAALEHAFREEEKDVEGERETYRTLALPRLVAPIKVGVFPLVNRGDLPELAERITHDLRAAGLNALYDDAGTIGRRYARMDEVGTPYCVTVDFETLEAGAHKDTVTVRDRDTTQQVRVKVADLAAHLRTRVEAPLEKLVVG